eukprot:CCRYP_013342-RA/>CCRYP_013342-RA protein AED:0.28 eAED:0.28 QI:85/1/1/1/0/0/2/457/124
MAERSVNKVCGKSFPCCVCKINSSKRCYSKINSPFTCRNIYKIELTRCIFADATRNSTMCPNVRFSHLNMSFFPSYHSHRTNVMKCALHVTIQGLQVLMMQKLSRALIRKDKLRSEKYQTYILW